jgi:hypothetical protein
MSKPIEKVVGNYSHFRMRTKVGLVDYPKTKYSYFIELRLQEVIGKSSPYKKVAMRHLRNKLLNR